MSARAVSVSAASALGARPGLAARLGALGALGAACALAGCAGGDAEPAPRPALLLTLDTTRSDALGAFGGPAGLTPALDALAAESLVFPSARTVAPLTLPSHGSMLTGLYPPRHGVRDNNVMRLPAAAETVAERARAAGFATAAFVAAAVLDPALGLDQGFETYSAPTAPLRQLSSSYADRPAREVVDQALAWLAAVPPAEPWFLWVHVFDPHAPYAPAPQWREHAGGDPYHGEVAETDHEVGRLLDALRARADWPETTVVAVADHGEGLGAHGEATHSTYLFETTLRVPLLVRVAPAARAPAARAPEDADAPPRTGVDPRVASVVDVHPTLLEAMGLAPAGGVDGESLLLPARAGRGVYFETYDGYLNYGWAPLAGWADAEGKYVHAPAPLWFDAETVTGPDLEAEDPEHAAARAAERGAELERYRRAIAAVLRARALPRTDADTADEATLERVRSLGYAALGDATAELPDPLAPTELPDPHARTGELRRCLEAIALREMGRCRDALPIFRAITTENPGNLYAWNYLASCLAAERRYAEAVPVLRRLLAQGPEWASLHYNLGGCLEQTGETAEALVHYRRSLELAPDHPGTLAGLARLLRAERPAEAARYLRRLRQVTREGGLREGGGGASERGAPGPGAGPGD